MERYECVIVGAGVAGVSLAWALSRRGVSNVVVVEREPTTAFHASGRSARTLLEVDPNPTIQRLKIAGAGFLRNPPAGFSSRPLLDQRGALGLVLAQPAELERTAAELRAQGVQAEVVGAHAAAKLCEALDERAVGGALHLPASGFIDVDALIDGFVTQARAAGVEFRHGLEISGFETSRGEERIVLAGGERVVADTVVNAAGAWAGELAKRAGCCALELTPLRRSLALYEPPHDSSASEWPLVGCDALRFYFRPLGSDLMVCPMDAEPSLPCDPRPVDHVLSGGLMRLRTIAPALGDMRLKTAWAGLRTFSNDGVPVVGRDPQRPHVFWLAALGGCGIETAALLAEIAADLLLEGASERFDVPVLAPERFHNAAAMREP